MNGRVQYVKQVAPAAPVWIGDPLSPHHLFLDKKKCEAMGTGIRGSTFLINTALNCCNNAAAAATALPIAGDKGAL